MKNSLFFAAALLCANSINGQSYTPVSLTGFNLDAVAENTTALLTTGGAIDGSDYVLYSAAYGALYSVANGLPNSGIISSATGTYQLEPYTQNNMLYLTTTQSGTISLVSPAAYAGLSLLGFATEGNVTFDVTLRFTDNSVINYPNQSFLDWFGAGVPVIAGFDRAGRNSGNPAYLTITNPKMYAVTLPINCLNRSKNIQELVITNTGSNARLCIMALSGASAPTFSANANPATCLGGTNGSASITAIGGIPPYTYTWSTNPLQHTAQINNLSVGVYSYAAQDNGGCIVSSTVVVTQTIIPEPSLLVSSNSYSVCSGNTFTLGASGANTYTWSGGNNANLYSPPVIIVSTPTTVTYNVSGLTAANCLRTGSISIAINPIPAASFVSTISPMCNNSPQLNLAPLVQQTGGVFFGPGVSFGNFTPSNTGVGTFVITYSVTDGNNCSNTATTSVQVFSLAPPIIASLTPLCSNAATIQLTANPTGGSFAGNAVNATGGFSPNVAGSGLHPIAYSIVSGPCSATNTLSIIVHAAPSATITASKTFFCRTSPALFFNGLPTGGSYSGPGMNGAAFNPSQATISNSNIIVYKYTDANGCEDTASIKITVSNCTNIIEQQNRESKLSIFPNPSTGNFFVETAGNSSIIIINEIGQLVKEFKNESTQALKFQLNLAPGVYFVKANREVRKLVITN